MARPMVPKEKFILRRRRYGELGFYLISDGGESIPIQLRRPCFIYYQAYPEMIKGSMIRMLSYNEQQNVIAGELDA